MVDYEDGSVLAQLGSPDMRVPIAHCLAYPKRMATPAEPLDLAALGQLTFEAPDLERFPALRLAREAARAGGALKKCVLELGGSDPYIILEDADLHLAVKACVKSRLKNNGQSCISAKRFVVVERILDQFVAMVEEEMKSYSYGDPTDSGNQLGPLVGEKYRDHLHDQVLRSIQKGAVCRMGGEIPSGKGYYYPPTLLVNVKKGMPAFDEELFGPVASIIAAKDEEDAIRIANDTVYGLGGAIFSKDVLKEVMESNGFKKIHEEEIPLVIREHRRKYQVS